MEIIRIGDKLVDVGRIDRVTRQVLHMRREGFSQQEVAGKLALDRTFISRLETIGSVRKGGKLGLVSFPVENKEELLSIASRFGIEHSLILTDKERWEMVEQQSGMDFFNLVMEVIARFRNCDTVLMFCSAKWNRVAEALLDNQVITREIGVSPIKGDVYVDPNEVEKLLLMFGGEMKPAPKEVRS